MFRTQEEHYSYIQELNRRWENLTPLSELAAMMGISDIFQDDGAKVLQQLIYLNFDNLPGREGNDAVDKFGREWELKSINIGTSATGFSTNHHCNLEIIAKYRCALWSFSIYRNSTLLEIYVMNPTELEPLFQKWEEKVRENMQRDIDNPHLNNPKIPIRYVREHGHCVYNYLSNNFPIDPCSLI